MERDSVCPNSLVLDPVSDSVYLERGNPFVPRGTSVRVGAWKTLPATNCLSRESRQYKIMKHSTDQTRRQWRIQMAKSLRQRARGENWKRRCGRGKDNSRQKKSWGKKRREQWLGSDLFGGLEYLQLPELGVKTEAHFQVSWFFHPMQTNQECFPATSAGTHRWQPTEYCFQLLSWLKWQRIMQCT